MAKRTTTTTTTTTAPVATVAPVATTRATVGASAVVVPRATSLRHAGYAAYTALLAQGAPVCPVALANAIAQACNGTAWASKPVAFYAHRARRTLALYAQAVHA